MCELFGMSAHHAATVQLSLEAFSRHGSKRGLNKDGWGIALYRGLDLLLVKEPAPAENSEVVRFIESHDLASPLVMSHIRHATAGDLSYANTHPFSRELGGRMHAFAHNGDLTGFSSAELPRRTGAQFQPIGETDSEFLFCELLLLLAPLWSRGQPPSLRERYDTIARFAAAARERGMVNFFYGDGQALFVHSDYREAETGAGRLPGLFVLSRTCPACEAGFECAGLALQPGSEGQLVQTVSLVASVPLSDENWRPLADGELVVLVDGVVVDPC